MCLGSGHVIIYIMLNLYELLHPPFCRAKSPVVVVVWSCFHTVYTLITCHSLSYIAQKHYSTKLNIDGCTLQDPYAIGESL